MSNAVSVVLTFLPLAFVVAAGPQIICSIFFATVEHWKAVSAAYLFGALIAVTGVYTAAYYIGKAAGISSSSSSSSSSSRGLTYFIIGILFTLVLVVFAGRKQHERPTWMGKLETAGPRAGYLLGLVLVGAFPTGLLSEVAVGLHLAGHGLPWVDGVPFIALTMLVLAFPAILVLLTGKRARDWLPKARHWMNTHSWIVSEIVLIFLLAIEISSVA